MNSVWKYSLILQGINDLELPAGAKVLHVDEQDGIPQMWVLVDPESKAKEHRQFEIRGTGHPVSEHRAYIGTWQSGSFVWHLFEKPTSHE